MNHTSPLSPNQMKTYGVSSPQSTHTRAASCDEVDCPQRARGWVTVVDESTELGQRQAHYIRTACRPVSAQLAAQGMRRYVETKTDKGWTEFRFAAGQRCFAQHRVPLDRPELYVARRGNLHQPVGRARQYDRADQWVDDFATELDGVRTIAERG